MVPKYTGEWNRGAIWRGDTLLGFSMRIADKDTGRAVVLMCWRIKSDSGKY